jgi:hypothetical protein
LGKGTTGEGMMDADIDAIHELQDRIQDLINENAMLQYQLEEIREDFKSRGDYIKSLERCILHFCTGWLDLKEYLNSKRATLSSALVFEFSKGIEIAKKTRIFRQAVQEHPFWHDKKTYQD